MNIEKLNVRILQNNFARSLAEKAGDYAPDLELGIEFPIPSTSDACVPVVTLWYNDRLSSLYMAQREEACCTKRDNVGVQTYKCHSMQL